MPGSISSATVYTNCWSSLISHTRILLTSKNFLLHSNWRTRRENRDQRSEVGEKRLAAAQCGMPMAFRLVLLNDFFLRLSLRKRGARSLPERPSLSALCGGKPQSASLRFREPKYFLCKAERPILITHHSSLITHHSSLIQQRA